MEPMEIRVGDYLKLQQDFSGAYHLILISSDGFRRFLLFSRSLAECLKVSARLQLDLK